VISSLISKAPPNEYYSVKDTRIGGPKQPTNNINNMFESNNPKNDIFSSVVNEKFDNIDQLKVHRGPLNLNAITMRDPNTVIDEICEVLQTLSINYKKLGPFNAKCEYKELKFIIEINYVEKFSNLFIVKFYKNNQSNSQYFDICNNIFAMLNL